MLSLKQFSITGLAAFSLSIADGECVGLSGISGSGKTRLLRAIADLDEHEGELHLDATSWSDVPANHWRQKVALLPAESLWWFDTIGEHFSTEAKILNQLGFDSAALQWDSSRCSSGEKQRLSILRLLANKPRVLLLDEPTANLDKANGLRVEKLIASYLAQNNASAIWVSHNQPQLNRVSSRRLRLQQGCLLVCDKS